MSEDLSGESWILRCPHGVPHGATMLRMSEDKAWRELATSKLAEVAAMVAEGWRMAREPNETAVPDIRARLGSCTAH